MCRLSNVQLANVGLTSVSVPHGGYITAVFLEVSGRHFQTTLSSQDQPHTIGLHLDFLRRTQSGAALFTVKDVKLGTCSA